MTVQKAKCKAESTSKQKNRQQQGFFTYAFVLHSTDKTFQREKKKNTKLNNSVLNLN